MTTEERPLLYYYAYFCPVHEVVSIYQNCYCGKQTMEVVVKIYRIGKRDAD